MLKCFFDVIKPDQIAGWAIDTENPDASLKIAVFANGHKVARAIADRPRPDLIPVYGNANHGFAIRLVPALSSADTYRISVRDVTTDKLLSDTYLFASASNADVTPGLRPIILTSTGRCGTTIMMDALACLPSVAIAGHYPYEMKLLTYYAQAAKVLCTPSYEDIRTDSSDIHIDPTRIGLNPFFNHLFSNTFHDRNRLYNFFGQFSSEKILNAFREIIEEFYKTVASEKGLQAPRYFAEKYDVLAQNRTFIRLLSPSRKEILLVRDLRDAYCSAKAFWSIGPDFIGKLVEAKNGLLRQYTERDQNLLLVRYEDLVERKNEIMPSIAAFLEVPFSLEPRSSNDLSFFKRHGTSATPSDSIGRWKRDLDKSEAAALSKTFSDFLAAFGYDP